jgi:hypothetical protein
MAKRKVVALRGDEAENMEQLLWRSARYKRFYRATTRSTAAPFAKSCQAGGPVLVIRRAHFRHVVDNHLEGRSQANFFEFFPKKSKKSYFTPNSSMPQLNSMVPTNYFLYAPMEAVRNKDQARTNAAQPFIDDQKRKAKVVANLSGMADRLATYPTASNRLSRARR